MTNRVEGNMTVTGRLSPAYLDIPSNTIVDEDVSASADIAAEKLEHYHQKTYGQANTAAADETRMIHVAMAAGEVLAFEAGSIAKAVGDATCTVDLKKNGSSILSAVITLDSANMNRVTEAATIASAAYVDGDVFEVVIDGTIGTGTLPTGVFCSAKFQEKAA